MRSPLDLRDLVTDVHCIIEAMVGREVSTMLPPWAHVAALSWLLADEVESGLLRSMLLSKPAERPDGACPC